MTISDEPKLITLHKDEIVLNKKDIEKLLTCSNLIKEKLENGSSCVITINVNNKPNAQELIDEITKAIKKRGIDI